MFANLLFRCSNNISDSNMYKWNGTTDFESCQDWSKPNRNFVASFYLFKTTSSFIVESATFIENNNTPGYSTFTSLSLSSRWSPDSSSSGPS